MATLHYKLKSEQRIFLYNLWMSNHWNDVLTKYAQNQLNTILLNSKYSVFQKEWLKNLRERYIKRVQLIGNDARVSLKPLSIREDNKFRNSSDIILNLHKKRNSNNISITVQKNRYTK